MRTFPLSIFFLYSLLSFSLSLSLFSSLFLSFLLELPLVTQLIAVGSLLQSVDDVVEVGCFPPPHAAVLWVLVGGGGGGSGHGGGDGSAKQAVHSARFGAAVAGPRRAAGVVL